jgi:glycosyltransferase involved in cell wall biosynthesis
MDDVLAFENMRAHAGALQKSEERLVGLCRRVFCSSVSLAEVLKNRYRTADNKLVILRNALSESFLESARRINVRKSRPASDRLTLIGYAGTVGEWFDFETILACLREYHNCAVHVWGPVETRNTPTHPRLNFHPPIDHAALIRELSRCDILMMPFQLTPLVRSVDPVKLYEYLALGKEVIAVKYPEIERFNDFVHLYESAREFTDLVIQISTGKLKRRNVQEAVSPFLERNTWSSRMDRLLAEIEDLS